MSMKISEWRVGDLAYMLEGDTTYPAGSIIPVGYVQSDGIPCSHDDGFVLASMYRKPVRVLQPGDKVPAGATYLVIIGLVDAEMLTAEVAFTVSAIITGMYALLSLPEPEPESESLSLEARVARLEQQAGLDA